MLFTPISTLVQKIIRPTRASYSVQDLGSSWFQYNQKIYERTDFNVPYLQKVTSSSEKPKQMIIVSSLFHESKVSLEDKVCVVFLHGNIGGRHAIISQLETFLKMGFCAACFDFIGCGMSEGQYITLGHEQKHQIHDVLKQIQQKFGIKQFILYGRSMGAASALLYSEQYNPTNLIGILVDSPYCDMDKLLIDISNNHIKWLPNFILSSIFEKTDEQIMKITGYSIYNLKIPPICNQIPIYIFYADKDQLISIEQINLLVELINGDKKLKIIEGEDHNAIRDEEHKVEAFEWILNRGRNSKKILESFMKL